MRETRLLSGELELRSGEAGAVTLTGYASVFDQAYQVGWFTERVNRRAFAKTVKEADVRALFNHDPNYPLGRVRAGTLRLATDDHGLLYEVELPGSDVGRRVAEAVERGDVTGSSFSFATVRDRWSDDGSERELLEVKLYDVGPVTFPANEATSVDIGAPVRSLARARGLDPLEVRAAVESGALWRLLRVEGRGVVPYQDLPLADRERPWDAAEAEARVREWAGGADWQPARYRRAFLWYDSENADTLAAYKLLIADIIGGDLVAVPRAIFAAAAALQGARGGVDIPAGDVPRCRAHLARYYDRLELTPPWERSDAPATDAAAAEPDAEASTPDTARPALGRLLLWRTRLELARDHLDTIGGLT